MLVWIRAAGSTARVALVWAIFSNEFNRQLPFLDLSTTILLWNADEAVDLSTRFSILPIADRDRAAILHSYSTSLKTIWIVVASLAGARTLSILLIKELTLEKEEAGQQTFN